LARAALHSSGSSWSNFSPPGFKDIYFVLTGLELKLPGSLSPPSLAKWIPPRLIVLHERIAQRLVRFFLPNYIRVVVPRRCSATLTRSPRRLGPLLILGRTRRDFLFRLGLFGLYATQIRFSRSSSAFSAFFVYRQFDYVLATLERLRRGQSTSLPNSLWFL